MRKRMAERKSWTEGGLGGEGRRNQKKGNTRDGKITEKVWQTQGKRSASPRQQTNSLDLPGIKKKKKKRKIAMHKNQREQGRHRSKKIVLG